MAVQIAVIGLGKFGWTLATEIEKKGYGVLAIDTDKDKVMSIEGFVSRTALLKSINEADIKETGIIGCEVAVIGFSKNIESNILLVQILKEIGVPFVMARVESAVHARILQKIGADDFFFPEEDMALRIANRITGTTFMDFLEISDEYAITEFTVPKKMIGKSIAELDLRKEKKVSILAIKRGDEVIIPPDPMAPLEDNDLLIAMGPRKILQEMSRGSVS